MKYEFRSCVARSETNVHSPSKCLVREPVYEVKCLCSRGQEWGEGDRVATPTKLLIFNSYDMKSLWGKFGYDILTGFKMASPQSWDALSWHFKASEDIMTKFKSQALHIIKIKYWNAGWSGNPPFLILALWNIGILLHKLVTRTKHFDGKCTTT